MHPSTRTTAITRIVAAAVVGSFVALVIGASPAAAHEGTAVIAVESQMVEQMSVSYVMRAVWDNDGHAAADATATVVAESPAGERVGPVTMDPTDDDGRYAATVEFPAAGDWNVRFTVVTPPGTLEITQSVPAAAAATETTASAETTSSSTGADTGTATASAGVETAAASQNDRERPTSSAGAALFFFIVVVIVLGACVVAYRSRGRRRAQRPVKKPSPTGNAATSATDGPAGTVDTGADTAETTNTGNDAGHEDGATADAAAGGDEKDTPAE